MFSKSASRYYWWLLTYVRVVPPSESSVDARRLYTFGSSEVASPLAFGSYPLHGVNVPDGTEGRQNVSCKGNSTAQTFSSLREVSWVSFSPLFLCYNHPIWFGHPVLINDCFWSLVTFVLKRGLSTSSASSVNIFPHPVGSCPLRHCAKTILILQQDGREG